MKPQFEVEEYLKPKKIRQDKKKHHAPHKYDDEESTFKAAGKKGHSRYIPEIEDLGFDDEGEYEQYRHLIK